MDTAWLLRIVQSLITMALVSVVLTWVSSAAYRRRHLARGVADGAVLAYPRWAVWLGVGSMAAFGACAFFAWRAPPGKGGPLVALAFVAFSLLGAVVAAGALADTFVVRAEGLARVRLGRSRALAWAQLERVRRPWGGAGLRLEAQGGEALEVAQLVEGFGVLCDRLLQLDPSRARMEPGAAELVLGGTTLSLEVAQPCAARWFDREDEPPPDGLSDEALVVSAGRAFAARMLWRYGAFLPFEVRRGHDGAVFLTHGVPRGGERAFAALRLEGREVVITTDTGTRREPLDEA
ncbi:MAG: hypothetical protein INH41_30770 [Myxococcaceae bacterium]|jgi:hypothetical protein|nr:hypothetical protein [Myxococcaceae bacterium]MCA3016790.1 hypothetical protein [Myxococcaceae bacterium]